VSEWGPSKKRPLVAAKPSGFCADHQMSGFAQRTWAYLGPCAKPRQSLDVTRALAPRNELLHVSHGLLLGRSRVGRQADLGL
jgi:hypothetical protein